VHGRAQGRPLGADLVRREHGVLRELDVERRRRLAGPRASTAYAWNGESDGKLAGGRRVTSVGFDPTLRPTICPPSAMSHLNTINVPAAGAGPSRLTLTRYVVGGRPASGPGRVDDSPTRRTDVSPPPPPVAPLEPAPVDQSTVSGFPWHGSWLAPVSVIATPTVVSTVPPGAMLPTAALGVTVNHEPRQSPSDRTAPVTAPTYCVPALGLWTWTVTDDGVPPGTIPATGSLRSWTFDAVPTVMVPVPEPEAVKNA
jgi:hypothetical protein